MKTKAFIGFLLLALIAVSYLWFESWVILGYTEGALNRKEKEVNDLKILIGNTLSPDQLIKAAEKNGMFTSMNTDDRFWQNRDAKLAVVVEGMTFYFDEKNNYLSSSAGNPKDNESNKSVDTTPTAAP
jgi:hypothetical protein